MVYIVNDMVRETETAYRTEQAARRVAETMAGNRSATDLGEIVLYGPGDGTTSVMVRRVSDQDYAAYWSDIPIRD